MKIELTEEEINLLRDICYREKRYIVDGVVNMFHNVLENDPENIESIIKKLSEKSHDESR